MKKFILLALLTGCGQIRTDGTQKVQGTVTIDIEVMKAFFIDYCSSEFPDSPELQSQCVKDETVKLIHFLEGQAIK